MMIEDLETNVYIEIEKYKRLIKKQEDEIAEKETIKDSLTASLVRKVKSLALPYTDRMLQAAFYQQNKEKEADRSMYEFVKKDLIKRLFKDARKVKLESIVGYGYDSFAYGFHFKCENITFEIKIPNTINASAKNLRGMWYGQYQLYYEEKPKVWDFIAKSYNLDDIAKAIEEFIAN